MFVELITLRILQIGIFCSAKKSEIEQKISKKIAFQEYVLDFSFVAFFLCGCANFSLKLAQSWILVNRLEQKNRE